MRRLWNNYPTTLNALLLQCRPIASNVIIIIDFKCVNVNVKRKGWRKMSSQSEERFTRLMREITYNLQLIRRWFIHVFFNSMQRLD